MLLPIGKNNVSKETYAKLVVKQCNERNEFGQLEDGQFYYFSRIHCGMSADCMRAIADELDRRNAKHNAETLADMVKQETEQ